MGRSVLEALHAVVSPEFAHTVLAYALAVSGYRVLPEEVGRAREFVFGPLANTLDGHLGGDTANAFLEGVEPMLLMAERHAAIEATMTEDRADETLRFKRSGVRLRTHVLVASQDPSVAQFLAERFVDRASVAGADNVPDLLMHLEASQGVVVIDGQFPPVDPPSLASMLPVEGKSLTVILWRCDRQNRADAQACAMPGQRWLACGETAGLSDLATVLSDLLQQAPARASG